MNRVHLAMLNSAVMSQLGVSAEAISETVKYTEDKPPSDVDLPGKPTAVSGSARAKTGLK